MHTHTHTLVSRLVGHGAVDEGCSALFQVICSRCCYPRLFFLPMILTTGANTARQTDVHSWHTFAGRHIHTHIDTDETQNKYRPPVGSVVRTMHHFQRSGDHTEPTRPPLLLLLLLLLARYDKRRSAPAPTTGCCRSSSSRTLQYRETHTNRHTPTEAELPLMTIGLYSSHYRVHLMPRSISGVPPLLRSYYGWRDLESRTKT